MEEQTPLDRLAKVVEYTDELKTQIGAAELALESLIEQYKHLVRDTIPEIMGEMSVLQAKLKNGRVVSLRQEVNISIADPDNAFKWLDIQGEGGIIKTNVITPFNRDEREAAVEFAAELMKKGLSCEMKETVHPMTLKSWAKERLENSRPIPNDLFSTAAFIEAHITKAK